MNFLERIRCVLFWTLDYVKGGKVHKALKLLNVYNSPFVDEEKLSKYHRLKLEQLLEHARNTVPYYQKINTSELKDWPVMNKMQYKGNYEAFLSTEFERNALVKMTTSGSTGTPFTCYQDNGKKRHVNAEVLYYNGWTGYSIGKRIIYLRSVVGEVAKSSVAQFAQNIYLLDCMDLSKEGIEQKLDFIKRYSANGGAMLMGYSSTLDAFRKYFDAYGYDKAAGCHIYGIVAGSEMLLDVTRNGLEKAFGCKCYSRYANEENGFLGQDGIENNTFVMNQANYVIEILKLDCDELAKVGEIGRVVITDLYNYAMPMIRYDTGDVGAWTYVNDSGEKRKAIGSFGGRKVDMVTDTKGNVISPHSITNLMWRFQNIEQFQFIQKTASQYVLKLNASGTFNDEQQIRDCYLNLFGRDADLLIEYVDEIPVLASGKRRYVVNEMLKT